MKKIYGFDSYNQMVWEEVQPSIRANEGGDTKPKVVIVKDETEDDTDRPNRWAE